MIVLAEEPGDDFDLEITVPTGRRSWSLANSVANVNPPTFRKDGAVTVATLPGRYTNKTENTLTVVRIRGEIGTAPTGSFLEANVLVNGTSVFTNTTERLRILAGAKTGVVEPTKPLDVITLRPGDVLTVDVTQVGSTVAGSDLTVSVHLN